MVIPGVPPSNPWPTLAHVPAKWTPVRREGHAPMNESRACPDSAGTGHALATQPEPCQAYAMTQRAWLAGVDGCRNGWVAAFVRPAGEEARLRVVPRLADVLDAAGAPALVAVDIPIGLPDRIGPGWRRPEQANPPLLPAPPSFGFAGPPPAAIFPPLFGAAFLAPPA